MSHSHAFLRCYNYYNYTTDDVFTSVPIVQEQTDISPRLEGTEEKLRNRESRPEDLHVIAELREMVSEREALVKKLVVSRARERSPPRRNQIPNGIVGQTRQNLCVPG